MTTEQCRFWPNTPGYVVTSVWKDYQGENIDGINYAPLQKRVGSQWYTVQGERYNEKYQNIKISDLLTRP